MNDFASKSLQAPTATAPAPEPVVSGPVLAELIKRLGEDLNSLDASVDVLLDRLRAVLSPTEVALSPLPDVPQNVGEHASELILVAARLELAIERIMQLTARVEV